MSIYYLPASFALIVKLVLLLYVRKQLSGKRLVPTLYWLLVFMTICNVLELLGITYSDRTEIAEWFLRVYYISLIALLVFFLQLSVLVAIRNVPKLIAVLNYSAGLIISTLILFSDTILAGAASIGYSITRVAGTHYWIFQAFAIFWLATSICVSLWGWTEARTRFYRLQSLYILIGMLCLAIPLFIVIGLMALGYKINVTLILPIGVSIFLVLAVYAIKNTYLFDLRIWIPFTQMYYLHRAFVREYKIASDGHEWTAAERRANHEKMYFHRALIDHDYNQGAVAKALGVSESTVSRKRKEYNI